MNNLNCRGLVCLFLHLVGLSVQHTMLWMPHCRNCCTHGLYPSHNSHKASNIPQCTILSQKYAHIHISVTKWGIVGYVTGELWHLCNGFYKALKFHGCHYWSKSKHLHPALGTGRCDGNFKSVISKLMFVSTSCEIALRWMQHNTCDDYSTLV